MHCIESFKKLSEIVLNLPNCVTIKTFIIISKCYAENILNCVLEVKIIRLKCHPLSALLHTTSYPGGERRPPGGVGPSPPRGGAGLPDLLWDQPRPAGRGNTNTPKSLGSHHHQTNHYPIAGPVVLAYEGSAARPPAGLLLHPCHA